MSDALPHQGTGSAGTDPSAGARASAGTGASAGPSAGRDPSRAEGLRVDLVGAGGISRVHADAWRALAATGFVTSVQGAEAARVARAAAAAGVRLFPAHVVRYFGEYKAIKDAIDAGRIGTVAVQRFSRAGSAPRTPWFFSESAGGGVRDLMIHDIDQAVWFVGPMASVYAVQNPPTVDDRVPAPVTAHVVLTHRSGVISHLHASWVAEGMPFRTSVEVSGSEGRVRHDSAEENVLRTAAVLSEGSGDYPPPPDVAAGKPVLRRDRRLRRRAPDRQRAARLSRRRHRGRGDRRGRLRLHRRRRPGLAPRPGRAARRPGARRLSRRG